MKRAIPVEERFSEGHIKQIISSFSEENAYIRDASIEFLRLSINQDEVKFDPLDRSLPLLLWELAYIDINSFTSRALNTYRDIFESRLSMETIEKVEDYSFEYGVNATYNPDLSCYVMDPEVFATYSRRISGSKFRLVNQTFLKGKILVDGDVLHKVIKELLRN